MRWLRLETRNTANGKEHSKFKREESESKLGVAQNNKGLKPRYNK